MSKYLLLMLLFSSCTINFNQTDTHGAATDLIDETTSEDVRPSLKIPLKAV